MANIRGVQPLHFAELDAVVKDPLYRNRERDPDQ
jgi:hypothetical protein